MPLDRTRRDSELLADPGVAPSLREEAQDFALACREGIEVCGVTRPRPRHEDLHDQRIDDRSPLGYFTNRPADVAPVPNPLLEEVGAAAGAGREQLRGVQR